MVSNAVETGSIGIGKAAEVTVRVREEQFTKKQAIVCVKTVIWSLTKSLPRIVCLGSKHINSEVAKIPQWKTEELTTLDEHLIVTLFKTSIIT